MHCRSTVTLALTAAVVSALFKAMRFLFPRSLFNITLPGAVFLMSNVIYGVFATLMERFVKAIGNTLNVALVKKSLGSCICSF